MSEMLTPTDEMTGIPLPIMPRADLPPVPVSRQRNVERIADWHHPFHPKAHLVGGTAGSAAVRNCRIQWTLYEDHHDLYHGEYRGPELPILEDQQFRTVVFAAAGYVPEEAIDFGQSGRAIRRPLDSLGREQLWTSGQLRVDNKAVVRDFLTGFALQKDFNGVRGRIVDEFLCTADLQRRQELGRFLLSMAAHDAAGPLRQEYTRARKNVLLPFDAAPTAGKFVFACMTAYRSRKALAALEAKLAA
jgi:hypothetical protein